MTVTQHRSPAFLGIDAGTTSVKAALFDLEGNLLALDRQEYQIETPGPSVVELDAEVYWRACCRAVQSAIDKSGLSANEIKALAISSQGETLIPVDREGVPTRKAIVWLDSRAAKEAEAIGHAFDVDELYHRTGQPESTAIWPAAKILWLRQHEPQVFARTARFLLVEDFLLHRLTGEYVTECGIQTSSLMLDIQQRRWWTPMLDLIGVSSNQLGCLLEPGQVVGPLCSAGAEATGLSAETVAVSGSLDQTVAAVGAGNTLLGLVSESTGGALAEVVTLAEPVFDPQRRVPCHCHAAPHTYCLLPWGQTAGMALRWFRDQFFVTEHERTSDGGVSVYDRMTHLARQVPAGSEGLIALPHLEGAACPEFNLAARGVFFGVSLRHTRAHFVRAIMESVAYMLKSHHHIIKELGVTASEFRSMGGGARSDLWLQIKADVLQKPVRRVAVEEAACLGAAMLASVAVGAYGDLERAAAAMVHLGDTFWPDASVRPAYQEGYGRYLELYRRLEPMFGAGR